MYPAAVLDHEWYYYASGVAASCALSGTATTGVNDGILNAGGKTVVLELTDDTWVAAGAAFNAQRQNIIDGMTSAGSGGAGWNVEIRDKEVVTAVVRTSNTVCTITLTANPQYGIATSESVTVTVPASALTTSGDAVVASPAFQINAVTVALSGTGEGEQVEQSFRDGSKTLILTVTNDTWLDAGAAFNATRQTIINGFTANEGEAAGWNAEVRNNEVVGAVVRTSATVVTVTLSAAASYQITASERVNPFVLASALTDAQVTKSVSNSIRVAPIEATLSGTLSPTSLESEIVDGGQTLIGTLDNDTWVASGATFNAQRQAILNGLTSAQSEAAGWNAEVRDKMAVGTVVRTNSVTVTITLTAAAAYSISTGEAITWTIPAAALTTSGVALPASTTFTIGLNPAATGTKDFGRKLRHGRQRTLL